MNIFSGLEQLGFKNLDSVQLFTGGVKAAEQKSIKEEQIEIEGLLYSRSTICPVCDNVFPETAIKSGKIRLVDTHTDMRPHYEPIDPMYYDINLCPKCGYTALKSFWNKIQQRQCDLISEKITPQFKPRTYPMQLSLDNAIERYKIALLCAVIKNAKHGEKAFLCLKLGWLYRSKGEKNQEIMFLQNAYTGFTEAYTKENFPICGIDESTLTYLIGELARRLGNPEEALRYMSRVIIAKNSSQRLKDRALTIKDLIKEDKDSKAKSV